MLGCAPADSWRADDPSVPAPASLALRAVLPPVFPTTGGALLQLYGAGFTADLRVEIDGNPVSPVTVRSSEFAEVRLPARVGILGPAAIKIMRGPAEYVMRSDLFRYAGSMLRFGDAAAYRLADALGAVISADFDNDGRPDLAAVSSATQQLFVLLQQPAGDFLLRTTIQLDPDPSGLVAADLDRDGMQDLIEVGTNELVILRGHGDGSFDSPQLSRYENGRCDSVVVADLDEDAALDIATACLGHAAVNLLWGDGTGRFIEGEVNGLARPCSVQSADFDRDGHPDLALGNCGEGEQSVTLLHRDATAQRQFHRRDIALPEVTFLDHLTVGDLDQDDVPDLVITDGQSTDMDRSVHIVSLDRDASRKRSQTFQITTALGPSWMGLPVIQHGSAGSFPDVLVGGGIWLYVLKNRNGVFTLTEPVIADTGCRLIVDLDRDGADEIVACDESVLQVIGGRGAGPYSHPIDVPIQAPEHDISKSLSVDLDRDGTDDLIYAKHAEWSAFGGLNLYFILSGRADDAFREKSIEMQQQMADFVIADVDNDSTPDIIIANISKTDSKSISILVNKINRDKKSSFDPEIRTYPTPIEAARILVAQLDEDLQPEIVLVGWDGRFCILKTRVRAADAAVIVDADRCFASNLSQPSGLLAADLDGDHRQDLVVTTDVDGVFVLWGMDDGKFSAPILILKKDDVSTVVDDVDKDGQLDLILTADNQVYIRHNRGNRTWSIAESIIDLNKPYDAIVGGCTVLDANGDGLSDLVVRRYRARHLTLLLNQGFGKSWQVLPIPTSADPIVQLVAGDVDADGRADLVGIAFSRTTRGHVVYLMNRSD